MGFPELEELRKRKRDQTARLMEVSDLTRQIDQALDRKDQVSVQMLLHMREIPIRQMAEIDEGIREYLVGLPEEDAIRYHALLMGDEEGVGDEVPFCDQVDRYLDLLDQVVEADRRVSLRLGGNRSFYKTFRE